MEHCVYFNGLYYPHLWQTLTVIANLQFSKFGTIIFFLLSGFLIGDKIKNTTAKEYLKKRLQNTIKPWAFWACILMILNYVTLAIIYFKFHPSDFWQTPTLPLGNQIIHIVFFTNFWFILNFMICLAILLAFKRYLDSNYFGLILLLCSLFYSVNLYFNWIPTHHTTAVFGFVFYLWLGYQLNKYFDAFKLWVGKASAWWLIPVLIISFASCCAESLNLYSLHSDDAFNTLRFSNIIFSLLCFIVLFKYSDYLNVSFFKPRQVTYGIYLIHQILILHFLPLIFIPMHINQATQTIPQMLAYQLIRFVIVYGLSYGISLLFTYAPKKARWVIGQ